MKKATIALLAVLTTLHAWADDITATQAQQQAQAFLNHHQSTGPNRRAQGTTPALTYETQVSGLYVFNVGNNDGFVIVSNDDATTPILGYSDSGHIDPQNMPANMRAWLQGYADQIAWLKRHPRTQTITISNTATRRASTHSTDSIAPLLTTTWNQRAPFNNLCPLLNATERAVTGCVATAMAQVMNYHQWPQAATAAIPAYTTPSYQLNLPALPAVTFDWANMRNSYTSSNYTSAEGTAVATLMQYCGWSVEMDYGPQSSSNTDKVAIALKTYFGYKSTTQFVSRSFYTADKWADLIYHELANQRPVFYGGQSSGGGHAFVCDGYRYEDATDFFHLNWGWGGLSDNYFVLSALDPDVQGIGGSTSTDGYHYGQDAVIGIQPSTGSGTIADITPNVINLTVNSMTSSRNPTVKDMPVDITLNITNNSEDDYDGDIYIGRRYSDDNYSLLVGNNFLIPAGETADVVIPFTPTETGIYNLLFFEPNDEGSYNSDGTVFAALNVIDASDASEISELFEDMCQITLELTDDYGDGWNGASIQVVDQETGIVLGTAANTNTAEAGEAQTYQIAVPNDRDIDLTWNSGSYDSECSFVVYDVSGEVIYEFIKDDDGPSAGVFKTYHVNCSYTPKPTDIAVTPSPTSATVTWTGDELATGYNLRYKTDNSIRYDFESAEPWAVDNFLPFTTYDSDGLNTYGVENSPFTNEKYAGSLIAFQNGTIGGFTAHSGNAFGCFMDATSNDETTPENNDWLISPEVTVTEGTVFSFWARSYIENYGLERFKVGVYGSTDGTFVSYLAGGADTYVEAPTIWTKYEYDLSDYIGQTIKLAINCVSADAFALFIDDIYIGNPNNDSWDKTIENVTSPYELTDLTPATTYELQVQGIYDEGTSDWTASFPFTTTTLVFQLANDDRALSTKNTDLIAAWNGYTATVTLAGRTLFKDGSWNTICLPFDLPLADSPLDGDGLTAKTLTEGTLNEGTLTLTFGQSVDMLQAGVPYIIKWDTDTDQPTITDPVFTDVIVQNVQNPVVKSAVTFVGTYSTVSITASEGDPTKLYLGANDQLHWPSKPMTMGSGRAYFQLADGITAGSITSQDANIRNFLIHFGDDDATAIKSLGEDEPRVDSPNDSWYTLDGRKLNGRPTTKGLYIHHGKKVHIK